MKSLLYNGNRTDNFREGWNIYFNKLVGTNNSSFWLVVQCIGQDEATKRIERTLLIKYKQYLNV
jgi:hypothetical protein